MPHHVLALGVALAFLGGCGAPEEPAVTMREAASSPQGFRVAEDPIEALDAARTILKKSAAIVDVTVENFSSSYDDHVGPRTDVHLQVHSALLGKSPGERTVLHLFGGPTDDGRIVRTSRTVNFVAGARYVLFLRNDSWFFDPLLGSALRVESIDGREILVNPDGRALTAFSPEGLAFGRRSLYEAPAGDGPPTLAADVTPRDVAGTLDRARLVSLLREAVEFEGVGPSGDFQRAPRPRPSWRIMPVDRDPAFVPASGDQTGIRREQPPTGVEP